MAEAPETDFYVNALQPPSCDITQTREVGRRERQTIADALLWREEYVHKDPRNEANVFFHFGRQSVFVATIPPLLVHEVERNAVPISIHDDQTMTVNIFETPLGQKRPERTIWKFFPSGKVMVSEPKRIQKSPNEGEQANSWRELTAAEISQARADILHTLDSSRQPISSAVPRREVTSLVTTRPQVVADIPLDPALVKLSTMLKDLSDFPTNNLYWQQLELRADIFLARHPECIAISDETVQQFAHRTAVKTLLAIRNLVPSGLHAPASNDGRVVEIPRTRMMGAHEISQAGTVEYRPLEEQRDLLVVYQLLPNGSFQYTQFFADFHTNLIFVQNTLIHSQDGVSRVVGIPHDGIPPLLSYVEAAAERMWRKEEYRRDRQFPVQEG